MHSEIRSKQLRIIALKYERLLKLWWINIFAKLIDRFYFFKINIGLIL